MHHEQESFGQTIDRLLAQALAEHKKFDLQITINSSESQAKITPAKRLETIAKPDFYSDVDDIFMIGHANDQ